MGVSERYFGGYFRDSIEKHLKGCLFITLESYSLREGRRVQGGFDHRHCRQRTAIQSQIVIEEVEIMKTK
jgi:hypothetical protein